MPATRMFIAVVAFALAALAARSSGQTPVAVFEQVNVIPMDRERVLADQHGRRARRPHRRDRRCRRDHSAGRRDAHRRPWEVPDPDAGRNARARPGRSAADSGTGALPVRRQRDRHHPQHAGRSRATSRCATARARRDRRRRRCTCRGRRFNGQTAATPEAAAARVAEQKKAGYDLLKIHPGVPRDAFDALAADGGCARHPLRRPRAGRGRSAARARGRGTGRSITSTATSRRSPGRARPRRSSSGSTWSSTSTSPACRRSSNRRKPQAPGWCRRRS